MIHNFFFKSVVMSETLAKVLVGAFFIVITTGLFIYQVRTTEKVGRNSDPCIEEYKDYCMNEGECFSHVEENIIGCLCPPLYGGKRCDKFLWWY